MSDSCAARATDVVLAYGPRTALAASSFEIPAGAVTAIIGPNGSGKTTVLHALAGLIEPESGTVEVLGTSPVEARSRVSYVLQSVAMPTGTPITVRETVAMGRYATLGLWRRPTRADRARVEWAINELEVANLRKRHLSELSGGQRQRVYMAQGIAQDHEVLLLDEPLTGLDLVSVRSIDRIVHAERDHGGTVVLTTHDLDEARAADHVLLVSGRVVSSGAPGEVLTRRNLEIAYGLGTLHETTHGFLDDPHHLWDRSDQEDRTPGNHDSSPGD